MREALLSPEWFLFRCVLFCMNQPETFWLPALAVEKQSERHPTRLPARLLHPRPSSPGLTNRVSALPPLNLSWDASWIFIFFYLEKGELFLYLVLVHIHCC